MKTMTEILTIPALKADREPRRPKRVVRWAAPAGDRGADHAEASNPDPEEGTFLPAQAGFIILMVD